MDYEGQIGAKYSVIKTKKCELQSKGWKLKHDRAALYLLEVVKVKEENISKLEKRFAALERKKQQAQSPVAKEVR